MTKPTYNQSERKIDTRPIFFTEKPLKTTKTVKQ